MTKTDKEKRIESEIIKSAMGLFMQYGLKKTTMEDVAEASGKGKSTLYYYFKNKEELFEMAIRDGAQRSYHELLEAINKESSFDSRLRTYLSKRYQIQNEARVFFGSIQKDIRQYLDLIYKIRKELDLMESAILKSIFLQALKDGEISSLPEDKLEALIYILLVAFRGMESLLYAHGERPAESVQSEVFIQMCKSSFV